MGGQASKAPRTTIEVLRRAGENMNTKAKFPLCDNLHQKLQKQGVNVGPAMLEIRAAPPVQSVGASSSSFQPGESPSSSKQFLRDGEAVTVDRTGLAALVGGLSASVIAGGAHFAGLI
ncbi:conserved hypothetical protein [Neospora caninum Liverpool]|uniref:Uncharacterized protein n=1 Tax=Neospora caninum (strain Liverpool) TaxID=572307 RepID=F0VHD2_NEOCL|nr:conserved hypothetical protein [Neospora caninum Liverpool]CBZ53126.1 conserved hypothetical protein [Neospora caninum Liverpool]|eukprot:XP_003883158.1 conserved hypothetical protein [Neospora caninum Liverpool]